jgi:hypothetical protein
MWKSTIILNGLFAEDYRLAAHIRKKLYGEAAEKSRGLGLLLGLVVKRNLQVAGKLPYLDHIFPAWIKGLLGSAKII